MIGQDFLLGDASKARKELGWMPKYDFQVFVYLFILLCGLYCTLSHYKSDFQAQSVLFTYLLTYLLIKILIYRPIWLGLRPGVFTFVGWQVKLCVTLFLFTFVTVPPYLVSVVNSKLFSII